MTDLETKFGTDNIPIENYRWCNMSWIPKMYRNHCKARFIVASPTSSIDPLLRTTRSIFPLQVVTLFV